VPLDIDKRDEIQGVGHNEQVIFRPGHCELRLIARLVLGEVVRANFIL
jgi:hypothetical protein